ncbi:DUF4136 domain-containing protein [Pontiella sulfatireligans]|uniref:DUF4136 domain-containing protein n=1 Tax=Pontiella sulfatireligans TaxID=2750658 RepID=A0A6C2UKA9_9BACT|nr:DUF4136 domain-containing protein [Pontiella sulfatireligans]VGO19841.1 hypothetical protein SCARR_01901 [Pontiella sulfatireligans]
MKSSFNCAIIASACMLTGCSSLKVTSSSTPGYDFTAIKTYEWVECPEEITKEHHLYINENFKKSLNNELSARGLKQVLDTTEAEVQTTYYITLAEHEEYTGPSSAEESTVTSGFSFNSQNKSWNLKEQESGLNAYTVEIGTLTMLLYDAKSDELVWEGAIKGKIDRTKPLEKQTERIVLYCHELMKHFPAAIK